MYSHYVTIVVTSRRVSSEVAESIPVEAGHSGRLEAGYSGERSPIRSMPPIGVVQHADGTISFRL